MSLNCWKVYDKTHGRPCALLTAICHIQTHSLSLQRPALGASIIQFNMKVTRSKVKYEVKISTYILHVTHILIFKKKFKKNFKKKRSNFEVKWLKITRSNFKISMHHVICLAYQYIYAWQQHFVTNTSYHIALSPFLTFWPISQRSEVRSKIRY